MITDRLPRDTSTSVKKTEAHLAELKASFFRGGKRKNIIENENAEQEKREKKIDGRENAVHIFLSLTDLLNSLFMLWP